MRKMFLIIGLCIVLPLMSLATIPAAISDAFKQGDGDKLSAFFDESVDLKVKERENIFSKMQARIIVKDFFAANKVSSFTIQHEGGPETAPFIIGVLQTSNGTFRVYCLLKKNAGQLLIQKFRLEQQ